MLLLGGHDVTVTLVLVALGLGLPGIPMVQIAGRLLTHGAERFHWFDAWLRQILDTQRDIADAKPGDLVCLEGRCAGAAARPLVSPVFRASCVAWWLDVRSPVLGRLQYRRTNATPFWLEREGRDPVLVDPGDQGMVELTRADDDERDIEDRELERHLEALVVRAGRADHLGISHGRLEPGDRCTVIGRVMSADRLAAPYRSSKVPMIGGGRTYIAPLSRSALLRQLWWRRAGAGATVVVAWTALGWAVGILGAALLLVPELVVLLAALWTALRVVSSDEARALRAKP